MITSTSTHLVHKPITGILCWLVYFYIMIVGFYPTILLPELIKYSDWKAYGEKIFIYQQ